MDRLVSLDRIFFAHERAYPLIENECLNGESPRAALLQALHSFYKAWKGPMEPLYFYDPYETTPKFSHDPPGATTTGRYTARFDSEWQQEVTPGRVSTEIALVLHGFQKRCRRV